LGAAFPVGWFAGVAADGDGGDGAAGEAFGDVVGIVCVSSALAVKSG